MKIANGNESDEKSFLREVLKTHFDDPQLVISSVSSSDASAPGYNFLSTIRRVAVSGQKGNSASESGVV